VFVGPAIAIPRDLAVAINHDDLAIFHNETTLGTAAGVFAIGAVYRNEDVLDFAHLYVQSSVSAS
jgi:hypothetical protein